MQTEQSYAVSTDYTSDGEDNFFDELYRILTSNADKIFAALAFVGTLIVGFSYKKGLIPLLSGAMTALKGTADSIKANGTELTRQTEHGMKALCDNTEEIMKGSIALREEITEMRSELSELDDIADQYGTLKLVMLSQIDMLYAIFMSSALPQYQKEEVGSKINKMREELKKYEKTQE